MNNAIVEKFLDGLQIRRKSRFCYACILRRFVRFCESQRISPRRLTAENIQLWLVEDSRGHPSRYEHRMMEIARFLTWCRSRRLAADPLAELRNRYNVGTCTIARALLQPNYKALLREMEPPPKWASRWAPTMLARIERMKGLGHRYDTEASDLLRFDRFLQQRPDLKNQSLSAIVRAWAESGRTLARRLRAQEVGRSLAKELMRTEPATTEIIIEKGLRRRVKNSSRRPRLFTEAEVRRLVEIAEQPTQMTFALTHRIAHASVVLLSCTGMRFGELARLQLCDLNVKAKTLMVRESKFYKTRMLPVRPSVMRILTNYLEFRSASGAPATEDAPLWWSEARQSGYRYSSLSKLIKKTMVRAGLRGRIHDLRHTFVAHRMAAWYREGVEVQTKLPHLATYLGHKDINSTLVYLTLNPEVLQHASDRYRRLVCPSITQEMAP